MSESIPSEMDEIVHTPDRDFVENTNVRQFMREHGIENEDELVARTTTNIGGVERSGIEWFWDELIEHLDVEFYESYDAVRDETNGPQFTDWYPGGKINVAHNVLDRHARTDPDSCACIWEGENGDVSRITYDELYREANQVANALVDLGVGENDTVGLYMPVVPEVVSVLYGCFKVGAVAVPIFSGYGVTAAASRLSDAGCSVLFTSDGFYRRGNEVSLKETADEARAQTDCVEQTIVYGRLDRDIPWNDSVDNWWSQVVSKQPREFRTRELASRAESMLLYSSGTTGKPKGIVQTHAGALVQCAKEIYFNFDHKPGDRFFWLTDIGWMMGPWALIGNHAFGGTCFLYEGAPDHPNPDRLWEMIDRHDLTVFGVSPTAVRALRREDDAWANDHDLSSLRLLGSAGEPWDPESWRWFYETIGQNDTPILNIIGGTEICGCFLMPLPTQPLKPCTVGRPGLGMDVDIVDDRGESIADAGERGFLVATSSCPSMTKSLWSGDERYLDEYWSRFEDLWDHGDWAQRDADGFWFLHGRADDALNVAGRKVGPAEIEGVAIEDESVTQAAAVGVPDDITGTAVVLYVIAGDGYVENTALRERIRERIGEEHGKPFEPREILFVDEVPKTQSGKIVRDVIGSVYKGERIGDTSGIENPASIALLDDAR